VSFNFAFRRVCLETGELVTERNNWLNSETVENVTKRNNPGCQMDTSIQVCGSLTVQAGKNEINRVSPAHSRYGKAVKKVTERNNWRKE
jgi:hypothetical protein